MMRKILSTTFIVILIGGIGMFQFLKKAAGDEKGEHVSKHLKGLDVDKVNWKEKTTLYWKENLSDMQFKVTRRQGTERAFTGRYWDFKKEGIYTCSNCGLHLFESKTKFKSGTGWPSFYDVIGKTNVATKEDKSFGSIRTEAVCGRCGAHLGHVFPDGPKPTGQRWCINSVSLNHIEEAKGPKTETPEE